ncbi:unnamed protein product [Bursaphelenchus xylophilus]|uniref:(pine wood nematode) hypothetical protein n=1 Tax=Bursaphelenchus xylophilus TaxID=6326 RepID=A0A1I7S8E5_BURXY|nr:unnamed protein product [Bursaphelenchus xylophilus]CAG9121015.1 unnamed protein product [Bursaphelenchus xylophilus]
MQGMIIRMGIGRPRNFFSIQIRLDGRYLYVFDEKCLSTDKCGNMFNRQVYNRARSSTAKDLALPMQLSDTAMGSIIEDEISVSLE